MPLRKPPSFLDPAARGWTDGRIFRAISQGYGLMPSYASRFGVEERWAVVGYVRALQASQGVPLRELPPELQRAFAASAAGGGTP